MLYGIVKPKGEVVDLDEMNDTLRASSRRCFEAGFLYGVNENGGMIEFDPEIKTEIFVKDQDQPAGPGPAADQPEPAADQDQTAEQDVGSADTELKNVPVRVPVKDRTGAK